MLFRSCGGVGGLGVEASLGAAVPASSVHEDVGHGNSVDCNRGEEDPLVLWVLDPKQAGGEDGGVEGEDEAEAKQHGVPGELALLLGVAENKEVADEFEEFEHGIQGWRSGGLSFQRRQTARNQTKFSAAMINAVV